MHKIGVNMFHRVNELSLKGTITFVILIVVSTYKTNISTKKKSLPHQMAFYALSGKKMFTRNKINISV